MRAQTESAFHQRAREVADEQPLDDIRLALLSAQEEIHDRAQEAERLQTKVARLEGAIRQLM